MKLLLFFLAAFYILFCLYLYIFQDKIIFRTDLAPKEIPLDKEIKVTFLDGLEVGRVEKNSHITIFYFGGNANNALEFLHHFKHLPYNLITFNYPGYGNSQGKPSQKAIFLAAKKVYQHYKTSKNILIGRSLGTGVASYLSTQKDVIGIILITPFHSITHLAQLRYPWCPIHLFLRHPFPNYKYLSQASVPVYVILAQHDDTTPPVTFAKLKPYIKKLVKVVTIEGAQHGDILQFEQTKKAIEEFVTELARESP
ncbi:hypothetical protein NitYY0826_C1481 [Nitratiruptor sp. YY08-26]|uniref:alpha/beta hydrolase n=1 Tax=unclassified Nitratiruptor TaxID=2624044 RepID=UPI0019160DC6|nr:MULTISPECIES: alpha/beta hydrolase [unclassified Nitratiruptor]BCD62599.1 hypothetical protein NitYY0813_C1479 [Nitratiruptor sp. YY08-13]BCD66535.1 hypothetical protein NitYY0826_C1481 [Nitratiruptor sp. YY08-26]